MIGSFVYGFFAVLVLVPLAVMAWHWMLGQLDERLGVGFRTSYEKIKEDSLALSIYHGCRLLAVAFIVGSLFSKFI